MKPSNSDNLYDVLQVPRNATPEEVKKAFRKLAIVHHPDKCTSDDPQKKDESEALFKKINEAYSILSDPQKRDMYDRFGTVENPGSGFGSGTFDMDELLRDIFGGGGVPHAHAHTHHMNAGGFSFVFNMGHNMARPQKPKPGCDVIDIPIDICDVYYGQTKKVEFEMPESCSTCQGNGAQDPSHVLNCMTCQGTGNVQHAINPFCIQNVLCPSCGGQGSTVQHNKQCLRCKGKKVLFTKKIFELKLPKGIPNMYEVVMEGKGSYNLSARCNNDVKFRFVYDIGLPYRIDDDKNVHYNVRITIEELLGGFVRVIDIYKDRYVLVSEAYFNSSQKVVTLQGMGLYDMSCEKQRDLFIHFEVEFTNNERLVKYAEVMKKVLKTQSQDIDPSHKKLII